LDVAVEVLAQEGWGKHKKKENQLYAGWWWHQAKDGMDMPGEPGMDVSIGVVRRETQHSAEAKPQQKQITDVDIMGSWAQQFYC
jgi:hypothetical protein